MRTKNINTLMAFLLGAILVCTGCSKDDGAITEDVSIDEVPTITTFVDQTGSRIIDFLRPATFAGKIKVQVFFPGATPPAKVDVVIRKNGSFSNVKVFKANVTSLPADFTVSVAELEALFGAPIAIGDRYDFAPDIYLASGTKYEAFPSVGRGTGLGIVSIPGFSELARFDVICGYDPLIYQGEFTVVSDAFSTSPIPAGTVINLSKVTDTSFSYIDPRANAVTPVPIVVKVNILNNQATIAPKITVGSYWLWAPTEINAYVATTGTATLSVVGPCAQTVTLNMQYTTDTRTSGAAALVLKKK